MYLRAFLAPFGEGVDDRVVHECILAILARHLALFDAVESEIYGDKYIFKTDICVSVTQKTRANSDDGTTASADVQQRSGLARSDDPYLLDGEEVLIDARPAWTAWFRELAIAAIILLLGLFTGRPGAIGGAIVVALLVAGYVAYQRMKVRYLVTDRRLIVATGISSNATNETWMVDIRGMQTGASLLERVLGHGHISVSSSIMSRGSLLSFAGLQGLTLGGISNHQEIAEVIRQRQAEVKEQS